jgi:hypothetical protein
MSALDTLRAQIAQITHREDLDGQMDNFIGAANELISVRLGIDLEAPSDTTLQYNEIFLTYPNLYLYASLISAYEFINEIDMADHYVARYENEITRYYITAGGSSPTLVMGGIGSETVSTEVPETPPETDGSLTVNGNLSVLGITTMIGTASLKDGLVVNEGAIIAQGLATDTLQIFNSMTAPLATITTVEAETATVSSGSTQAQLDVVNTAGNGGVRIRSVNGSDRGDIGYVDSVGNNFDNRIAFNNIGITSLLFGGLPVLATKNTGVAVTGLLETTTLAVSSDATITGALNTSGINVATGSEITFTEAAPGEGININNPLGNLTIGHADIGLGWMGIINSGPLLYSQCGTIATYATSMVFSGNATRTVDTVAELDGTLAISGTVGASTLSLGGLGIYADNAAAITGGLAVDDVYKTATGELRIVI